ncbi:ACT domain-containing protein [Emergencia timonensis]|uniref:amino acid kinase family protein n=1 Tax=Emergencia timonensis TaxID=1776384 RepID=UPI0039949C8E
MNIVQKYGGCYLKNMEDLSAIASHLAQSRENSDSLVLVTAAMQEIAEAMSARAASLETEIGSDKLDAMFSAAEKQTAALMAAALEREGLRAAVIEDIKGTSLSEVEVFAGKHELEMGRIEKALQEGVIPVVAGFQGIGKYGAEDVQGRYGAAATAVAIAAGLGCDCQLYGNTKGIYTREPAEEGSVIEKISYEEAMELIMLGESDLESRAIELAKAFGVEVYVGPAMEEEKSGGTYIMDRSLIVQEAAVTGLTVSDDIVVYTLKGMPTDGDRIAELFELLSDLSVNIDMISQQTCSEHSCAVSFSCSKDKISEIDQAFEVNQRLRELEIYKQDNLSLVSLVGVGMASHVGVAGRVFSVLAQQNIHHYNITTSEISISVAIDSSQKAAAVVSLSEAFGL